MALAPEELEALVIRMSEQMDILSRQLSEERVLRTTNRSEMVVIQEKYTELSGKIDTNTGLTQEIVDIFSALKGGIRVIGWVGNLAKWTSGVAVAVGAIYVFWKKHWPGS